MSPSAPRMLHLVSAGTFSSQAVQAFLDDLQDDLQTRADLPELTLVDGRTALDGIDLTAAPTVLLNADRAEVMDLLALHPLAAAVEKYALFAWWKHRGTRPGAFWLHGHLPVARRLGPDIVESPLYRTDAHGAFGSEQSPGLPDLLARYLAAFTRP
ncbi:hypothetical protein [Chondromyces apiculatus]|uniref:Uncharacterized protein n=1 Tax=Chondromyces apiculatus DSM 436 TaxID=1192034 RepID=A0A017TEM1_9BACT|nr:hypothetical protein [Chondromyces apiculatus]EYF07275.1 Hypothetical protein CAP_0754 [Chondromyces apiculatus DSM 436]